MAAKLKDAMCYAFDGEDGKTITIVASLHPLSLYVNKGGQHLGVIKNGELVLEGDKKPVLSTLEQERVLKFYPILQMALARIGEV